MICRSHQQQQHASLRTTTTFFIDHSLLLNAVNQLRVMAEVSSGWKWHVDVTLVFYRELSHVKSKPHQSRSRVYHLLSTKSLGDMQCYTNTRYDLYGLS